MSSLKKILAVIPARGGSKGVKLKNLRTVAGKSLLVRAIETVQKTSEITQCVVSTDHDQIADEAEKAGVKVPFRRPEELSGDRIGDLDVLTHALIASEKHFETIFDIILMVQPTSPLRLPEDLSGCLQKLIKENFDAVWTVSPTDLKYHPLKQLAIIDGLMDYFDERGSHIVARQQLTPVYHRNGCGYAFTRECLLLQKSIIGNKAGAYVIERPMLSIDSEEDIQKTEEYFSRINNQI